MLRFVSVYKTSKGYEAALYYPEISGCTNTMNTKSDIALLVEQGAKQGRFARCLLEWYQQNRRDLPWRRTRDPYAIWISETMLQQTQVATVVPYWNRWLERFPTVTALAEAPLEDVLKHWQGLGYYARARNLHRAAQEIQINHGGKFPTRFAEVLALPGVGRYTAGAVCSIALEQDVPIVDANVIRVLCRVFGLRGDPKSTEVQATLWQLAEALIPAGEARDFNQALMELGALVCGAKPICGKCPVSEICVAFASGNPESLPEFAPKPEFTQQTDVSAILAHPENAEYVLAVRRPEGGLWGGLWEFPRVTIQEDESPERAAERAMREIVGLTVVADGEAVAKVRHGVTTRKITLLAISCHLTGELSPKPQDGFSIAWATLEEWEGYALSSPQAKLLHQLRQKITQPTLF